MGRDRNASVVPYVSGGTPGALVAFFATEAILSIISCVILGVAAVASMFTRYANALSIISLLISTALSVYTTVLAFRAFTGMKQLHRGDTSAASTVAGVCQTRRVLIWIFYGLTLALQFFSILSSRNVGVGFLALLLAAGVSLLVVIPVVLYYKSAEAVLGHIAYEGYSAPRPASGYGRLSVLCIIFASLLAVFLILAQTDYFALGEYATLIRLAIYLYIARYLLVNLCYLGFMRSHAPLRTDENAPLAPAGYSDAPAICVLGSIIFGWFAVSILMNTVAQFFRYSPNPLSVIRSVLFIAAYVLFGLALVRSRGRTPMAITGAGCILLSEIIQVFNGGLFYSSDAYAVFSSFELILIIQFLILFLVGVIIRGCGKTVPSAIRIILIIIACVSTGVSVIGDLVYQFGYRYNYFNPYSYVSSGLLLVAWLALVRMLSVPKTPVTPEKETIQDQTAC